VNPRPVMPGGLFGERDWNGGERLAVSQRQMARLRPCRTFLSHLPSLDSRRTNKRHIATVIGTGRRAPARSSCASPIKPETTFGNVKAGVLADKGPSFKSGNFCACDPRLGLAGVMFQLITEDASTLRLNIGFDETCTRAATTRPSEVSPSHTDHDTSRPSAGNRNWKIAPCGRLGLARNCPPWASMIVLQIESPMPMPLDFVV